MREIGELSPPPDTEISDEPSLGIYHLGALAPIGPADRQAMLDAPTLSARSEVLRSALEDAAAVLEFRRT